jgi:STE24 endopeptidase
VRIGLPARLALLTLAGLAWVLAAGVLWDTDVPGDLVLPRVDPDDELGAAHVREAGDYAGLLRGLWAGGTGVQLLLLGALAAAGPALARRLPGGRLARGVLCLVTVLAALWLVRLPFGLVAHWWRRRHGISAQDYLDWLVSPWLELLEFAGLAVLALAIAMALARRLGRRWWLAGAPLLALLGAASVLVGPILLAPRLEPLADARLVAEIRELGRRQGVHGLQIRVREASTRTVAANAEVAGLGPTARVVLWDTLLDGRFPAGEVQFVAAHEVAHVANAHLWKGIAWLVLFSGPVAFLLAQATRLRGGMAEPAAVPLAVLAAFAIQLAVRPAENAISRRYEAEADWAALEATRDPAAARGLFRRLSTTALADPSPPMWSYVLRSTHPSLVERIAMADAWATLR